ncbi:MAG TPA: MFS transporter [Pseudonocardiaceae bacterium]|nr:MFS transporter [Pseudonocardiaceae bacterium]
MDTELPVGTIDPSGPTRRPRPRWWPAAQVSLLSLMQLMLVIDNSVVNVALPTIKQQLGFSAATLSWVITAYALVFGGLVLLSGKIGALIGPRRALLIGASVFVVASALGGFAVAPAMLILARVLQGVGAALAAPSTLVLIMAVTAPGPARARAMSLFVIAIGGGVALGLVLGGVLTTGLGWRSVMFINVPIGLAILAGVVGLSIPEAPRSAARLDVGGALTSAVAMAALVYGLITAASAGWHDSWVIGSFALAAAALVALVAIERRHPSPVVPPSFFATMRSAAPLLAMLLIPAGQFGFLYFATLFTQTILGYTPLQTGLAITPFTAALLLANIVTPRLVTRYGERVTGILGMTSLLLGLLWMAQLHATSTFISGLLGPFAVLGLGAGLTIAPLTAVIMNQAPPAHIGVASSLNQGMQQLGGALGLAVLTTVFAGISPTAGAAQGMTTALLIGALFPTGALILFAIWARRTTGKP